MEKQNYMQRAARIPGRIRTGMHCVLAVVANSTGSIEEHTVCTGREVSATERGREIELNFWFYITHATGPGDLAWEGNSGV